MLFQKQRIKPLLATSLLALAGCDGVVSTLFIPDPIIERKDCDGCQMVQFRSDDDASGTLSHALELLQPAIDGLPSDKRPLYIAALGVDMNGKLPLNETSLWSIGFISDSAQSYYTLSVDEQNEVKIHTIAPATVEELNDAVQQELELLNITPFETLTMEDLLAIPLPDSPTVLETVTSSDNYSPSPYSFEALFYDNGSPVPVAAGYAASWDVDYASMVTYDQNGIKVVIPNENEWEIVDFDSRDVIVADLPKEQWIKDYYGKVDRSIYLAARKIYSVNIMDTEQVVLLATEVDTISAEVEQLLAEYQALEQQQQQIETTAAINEQIFEQEGASQEIADAVGANIEATQNVQQNTTNTLNLAAITNNQAIAAAGGLGVASQVSTTEQETIAELEKQLNQAESDIEQLEEIISQLHEMTELMHQSVLNQIEMQELIVARISP